MISGSLDLVIETLIPNYEKYFDHILINKIIFEENGLIKDVIPTEFDQEHKATGLVHLCEKEGINPEEVVFIGDNHNDVHIAKKAGFSIAFNCKHNRLAKISDVVIKSKDLREVLPHIIKN